MKRVLLLVLSLFILFSYGAAVAKSCNTWGNGSYCDDGSSSVKMGGFTYDTPAYDWGNSSRRNQGGINTNVYQGNDWSSPATDFGSSSKRRSGMNTNVYQGNHNSDWTSW